MTVAVVNRKMSVNELAAALMKVPVRNRDILLLESYSVTLLSTQEGFGALFVDGPAKNGIGNNYYDYTIIEFLLLCV